MEKILPGVSGPILLGDGDFIHVSPAEPAQRVVKVNYHCAYRLLLFFMVGYMLINVSLWIYLVC